MIGNERRENILVREVQLSTDTARRTSARCSPVAVTVGAVALSPEVGLEGEGRSVRKHRLQSQHPKGGASAG